MAEKRFLIVVDMQNDFITGSLGTKEAQAILPGAAAMIRRAREEGWTVIATMDTHGDNYMDTSEGRKLPVPHCIRGTWGWEINEDIRAALGECVIVEKPTFGSVRLPEVVGGFIREGDRVEITFMGLCTDICVVSNALLLKAFFPEADIRTAEKACAGVTPEKHAAALETMRSCQIGII